MMGIARWAMFLALLIVIAGCARQTVAPLKPAPTSTPTTKGEQVKPSATEIAWDFDYKGAVAKAKAVDKPLMVDCFATWCQPCKLLDETVFSRADVAEASKAFVMVKLDVDKNSDIAKKLKVSAYPTVLFLTPDGKEIGRSTGAVPYQNMLDSMAEAQKAFRSS